ncbi:MAG: transporter substrate-binding domain-containing protein [Anaerolineales bacterium]
MKRLRFVSLLALAALVLTACAPAASTPANDKLAEIKARGTLIISTDPAYPPQSALKAEPKRTEGSKCASDQKTTGELEGFDVDVAVAIAKGLGVEACFVTPDWTLITAGGWSDRWDLSVGSMTITPERAKVLFFAQPYYTTPAAVFIHTDNTTLKTVADLAGKKVGVCGGCTYENYLNASLVIPGETINFAVTGAEVKTYDTDSTALEDLALGDGARLDAVITAQPTGEDAIKNGRPFKQLGDPVFFEYLAPAIDRNAGKDPQSFIAEVSKIIQGLHTDGTLKGLTVNYYGADLAAAGGKFDLSKLGQP